MWFKRNRNRVTAGFGALLVTMAISIPAIVPAGARSDVLIMTLLFGVVGAGMVYVAVSEPGTAASRQPSTPTAEERARALLPRRNRAYLLAGLAFGIAIVVAGAAAPWLFPDVGPDERFAMMIGFAPVAIAGAVLVYVFWRALRPQDEPGHALTPQAAAARNADATPRPPAPRRPPVTRVPKSALFEKIVPIGIVGMMVVVALIIVFLLAVVISAVLPML